MTDEEKINEILFEIYDNMDYDLDSMIRYGPMDEAEEVYVRLLEIILGVELW